MRVDIEIQRQVIRYLYIAKMGVTKIGELLGISHLTATAIKTELRKAELSRKKYSS
jgi:DNA-directed RNA polymerase specialized sigma subunit